MTPSLIIRPVLGCLAAMTLAGCGVAGADAHRFEDMAEAVAAIPLDGRAEKPPNNDRQAKVSEAALRPALKVEVMDPHALWDARDGGLQGIAKEQGQRLAAAAAPAFADALVRDVSSRLDAVADHVGLESAPTPSAAESADNELVQIGAYSSEEAARTAWSRLGFDNLAPVYESVEVGGRRLTRLKVRAPAAQAAAVCAAAGVDDPWCRRAT